MGNYNNINLNDFQFWKYDFKTVNRQLRTGNITPNVTELDWFTPIGFTKNNSLIVLDIKGKKQWIKEEFWNSSNSPFWKTNDRYGILVRFKDEPINWVEIAEKIAYIKAQEDLNTPANNIVLPRVGLELVGEKFKTNYGGYLLVMAFANGYYMARYNGAMPFCCNEFDLKKQINISCR